MSGDLMMKRVLIFFFFCVIFTGVSQNQAVSAQESNCGMLNCHGVDAACGFNAPQACDMMYRMGDFCRQYISCQVTDGQCQAVTQAPFEACRACVLECEKIQNNPVGAFDCESTCRQQLE
jgi:hypothetical protein